MPSSPPELSYPPASLGLMLFGIDLDGVVCDLGPGVAARIAERFGVASHPDTWRTFDLRRLDIGVPEAPFRSFIDEVFADPGLYERAPVAPGAGHGLACMVEAGWRIVAITARPPHLAGVTRSWLRRAGLPVGEVHHAEMGQKAAVARALGTEATLEDNPHEAELLAEVCRSWLLERPYNREYNVVRAQRLRSWDDVVGRLCQFPLFA